MINATAVNAITSGENEKVKWWEKNGIVTVKLKAGNSFTSGEVIAHNLPVSITGESVRFAGYASNSSTARALNILPNGDLVVGTNLTTTDASQVYGMYQC